MSRGIYCSVSAQYYTTINIPFSATVWTGMIRLDFSFKASESTENKTTTILKPALVSHVLTHVATSWLPLCAANSHASATFCTWGHCGTSQSRFFFCLFFSPTDNRPSGTFSYHLHNNTDRSFSSTQESEQRYRGKRIQIYLHNFYIFWHYTQGIQ